MTNVTGSIVDIKNITSSQSDEMFELMKRYYRNMRKAVFLKDLNEKEKTVLIVDKSGSIKGFSTIVNMNCNVSGQTVRAVFSGDTIVERHCRNNMILSSCLAEYFWEASRSKADGEKIFWYLIAKGYRTYRHLSVFFKKFYPCHCLTTPEFERSLIHSLSELRFGSSFNPNEGIIKSNKDSPFLRNGLEELAAMAKTNPHIRYFFEKNPGYTTGDELACVAELTENNFSKAFFRVIKRHMEETCVNASI